MSELISIVPFNPSYIPCIALKARLEEVGIPCFIKNEFAAFKKMGGRTELQISSSDFERALPILKESNLYHPENISQPQFLIAFNSITKRFPIIKNLTMEMRLLIFTVFTLGLISVLVFYILNR